jgi:hypothetical protein
VTQCSSGDAIFLHHSRLGVVRRGQRGVALFSEISSDRSLRDQHFNGCNSSLIPSLDGHTLPGSQNWRAMDGDLGWSRIDGGIPSCNRYRRIGGGAGRLPLRSKAAAPQMSVESGFRQGHLEISTQASAISLPVPVNRIVPTSLIRNNSISTTPRPMTKAATFFWPVEFRAMAKFLARTPK